MAMDVTTCLHFIEFRGLNFKTDVLRIFFNFCDISPLAKKPGLIILVLNVYASKLSSLHNKKTRKEREKKKVVVEINVSHDIFVLLLLCVFTNRISRPMYTQERKRTRERKSSDFAINHIKLESSNMFNK